MKIIRFIYLMVADAYYGWAMRERLSGTHPDLPRAILRRNEIQHQLRRMFA